MTTKERLLNAIETTPEPILALVLAFLEFLQGRSQTELAKFGTTIPQVPSANQAVIANVESVSGNHGDRPILRHVGQWTGDDLEICLEEVHSSRGRAEF
ncbi:MAG: hypothetical protein HC824_06790 [Synechococcales cyanobacterium RM1_1_8]|nr:hypothetical protein [Synechococcales cyanobacterium RM1_1_8]